MPRARMRLRREHIAELQFFLMDGAKRYALATGPTAARPGNLLSSAAALDYVLLVELETDGKELDEASPVAESVREAVTRAAAAALELARSLIEAREDAFTDFIERHVRTGGLFEVLRALREDRVVISDDIAYATLTAAHDILERRQRRPL